MNPESAARKQLRDLPKTVHGGQAWKLSDIEDYSQNLNPFGPPEIIEDLLKTAVGEIGHYPDDNCTELKDTISHEFGVDTDSIIIGAGSSDIIRMFPNTFLNENDKVVISRPSFAEYSQQCRIAGAEIIYNELTETNDFRIDYDELLNNIDKGAKAVYICNPNNPTGRIEPREKILTFTEECERKGVLVFLDETLLELVPDYDKISCVRYIRDHPNLLIAGSLTKSFAIPGIRIGFGFGSTEITDQMNKVRMTWNVGQLEQKIANILIRDHMDYVRKAADLMHDEVKWVYDQLDSIDFPVTPTDSFFFFNSLKSLGIDGRTFKDHMLSNGIMIRDCSSFGKSFDQYIRFCVKDRERDERFIDAVRKTMETMRR